MILKFFTAPENAPFLAALAVLFAMSLVVVAATVMGFIGDASLDAEVEGPGEALLDALGVSSTPSSIFVVVVSSSFFIGGFVTQWASYAATGRFLSGWIAIFPALVFTLLAANGAGRIFKKFKIKEETSAVHSDSFVGKTAFIVGGTARRGLPAQGKLVDEHGQVHYFLVEPAREDEVLPDGLEVVLILKDGPKFFAIPAEGMDLSNIDFESLTKKIKK